MVAVARELARRDREYEKAWIDWAYALRELNRVTDAKAVLLEAEPLHGTKCGLLHYNLACYHRLLGELKEAKARLEVEGESFLLPPWHFGLRLRRKAG